MSFVYTHTLDLGDGSTLTLESESALGIVDAACEEAAATDNAALKAMLESRAFTDNLISRAVFTVEAEALVADFARTLASVDNPEFVDDGTVTLDNILNLPSVRDGVQTLRHVLALRMLEVRQAA